MEIKTNTPAGHRASNITVNINNDIRSIVRVEAVCEGILAQEEL